MDKYRKLGELMKNQIPNKEIFFTAKFVSSQGDTCTIDIEGLKIDGVRLKPTTMEHKSKVLLTPKEESSVLIGSFSGNFDNLFVISADEVENIEITCNGQNVMSLISQLIQTLSSATIITPTGNGSFDPSVISNLKRIETSFKQIFK